MSQGIKKRFWKDNERIVHRFMFASLLLASPCTCFLPNFWSRVLTLSWDSYTHQYITEQAILNVTLDTLQQHQGHRAEEETRLGRSFWRAVGEVVHSNAEMDFLSSTRSDPVYHFDSERVDSAVAMLRRFWAQTLLSVRANEYQSALHSLGQLFHSLQDFYSHSNWVEMGQRSIYLHLLHPEEPAVPVAEGDTPTCMECFSATCRDNLLPRLTSRQREVQLLTTGYFSTFPPKPEGKCSHGGMLDSSRSMGAKGGINKDSTSPLFSPHHFLHVEAAKLASDATLTVLRDLRNTVGHKTFLRLFSVKQAPALVFVMDTTGSMFEEITAARLRAHAIIRNRADLPGQPGSFLLVPFHDPQVGPVYETDDPDQFMEHMENLMALGGGDEPEMCLTAIQLALTHSPPMSEIFVFTDASPKDAHMFDVVKGLTLAKQSKVTFLLTEDPNYTIARRGSRRRKRSRQLLPPDRFSLYSALSSLSGGLTIFTSNSDIHSVSSIVEDNTAAAKVTLLHVERDQEQMSLHSFRVDSTVNDVTVHITGSLSHCILIDPSGQSQSLLSEQGSLASLEHFNGLYRVRLLPRIQPGQWYLHAKADGHVAFNVIGTEFHDGNYVKLFKCGKLDRFLIHSADSSVDFLYYFATVTNETHPGLARVEGSPVAGVPTFLVLAVTGLSPHDEEVSFSHVTLLGAEGENLKKVLLNSSSSPSVSSSYTAVDLIGWVDSIPRAPFSVRLTGRDGRGNKLERVATEMVQPTRVQIQVLSTPPLVPGHSTTVGLKILNHGPDRLFTLTAEDDAGYLHTKGPHRFHVEAHNLFHSQVGLHTPASAQAGATVTLTLSVYTLDSADTNYAVAYLTVLPPDLDTSPPSCSTTRLQSSCSPACNESTWNVSLAVWDRGRSGLAALQLHKGQGTLTLLPLPVGGKPGETHPEQHVRHKATLVERDPPLNVSGWGLGSSEPLWVSYTSSCCSAQAELLVWDTVGNLKHCHLASSQQRQLSDTRTENRGGRHVMPYGFSFLVLILLCCQLLS
ncbi:von Willebrand factor A domain-containing protein 7 isoform X1 [Syngnathus scovelli]|uniref:von Willebrand factor A domain-containing protein 7 isoform X1 n=1 Tax=Syngnathus scovelli TaxID=161590 RepID=UPI0021104DA6|nr:von Willebrand factor A domain-containing protein 7 isoform X1 [Syngnathus scovelli]